MQLLGASQSREKLWMDQPPAWRLREEGAARALLRRASVARKAVGKRILDGTEVDVVYDLREAFARDLKRLLM